MPPSPNSNRVTTSRLLRLRGLNTTHSSPFRLVFPEGGSCGAGLPRPGNALLEASQYDTPLTGLGKHWPCCMQEFATLGRVDERRRVTIVLSPLPTSRQLNSARGLHVIKQVLSP